MVSKQQLVSPQVKIQLSKLVNKLLSKYTDNIRKVNVTLAQKASKKCGPLTMCQVDLVMPGLPMLTVKAGGKNMAQALNRALQNAKQIIASKYLLHTR